MDQTSDSCCTREEREDQQASVETMYKKNNIKFNMKHKQYGDVLSYKLKRFMDFKMQFKFYFFYICNLQSHVTSFYIVLYFFLSVLYATVWKISSTFYFISRNDKK